MNAQPPAEDERERRVALARPQQHGAVGKPPHAAIGDRVLDECVGDAAENLEPGDEAEEAAIEAGPAVRCGDGAIGPAQGKRRRAPVPAPIRPARCALRSAGRRSGLTVKHERNDVLAAAPLVAAFVGELPDEAQTPPAPARLGERGRGPRERMRDRIERPSVVRDLERDVAVVHRHVERDRMRALVVVGVTDDVGEQLGGAEIEAIEVVGRESGFVAEHPEPVARLRYRGDLVGERQPARSARTRAAGLAGGRATRRRARSGRHRDRARS